jgi:hypothetical protein
MKKVQEPPSPSWWKFWRGPSETVLAKATVLLAIATGLLAGIAAGQAWILASTDVSTRKAAEAAVNSATTAEIAVKAARENFRMEQRPVVWLTNELGTPQFVPNTKKTDNTGQIVWDFHFTNYGKLPALHMSVRHFMKIDNIIEPSYGGGGQVPEAPLPNNKVDVETTISHIVSLDNFERLIATDEAIGISGDIIYHDSYGEKYETTFCLIHLSMGATVYCNGGNDIR